MDCEARRDQGAARSVEKRLEISARTVKIAAMRLAAALTVALTAALTAAVALLPPGVARAGLAEERAALMQGAGRHLRLLAERAKTGDFDRAANRRDGEAIGRALGQSADQFPPGSEQADKAAGPDVWTNRADFDAARQTAVEAAARVATAADAEAFAPALMDLAAACKACHTRYRVNSP